MAARQPKVYSIAAHRGFADALVAGLLPRYSEPEVGLARLTLLLPSTRAVRTVSEAFISLERCGPADAADGGGRRSRSRRNARASARSARRGRGDSACRRSDAAAVQARRVRPGGAGGTGPRARHAARRCCGWRRRSPGRSTGCWSRTSIPRRCSASGSKQVARGNVRALAGEHPTVCRRARDVARRTERTRRDRRGGAAQPAVRARRRQVARRASGDADCRRRRHQRGAGAGASCCASFPSCRRAR